MKKKIYFKQFLQENGMQNEDWSYNFVAIRDWREKGTGNTILHLIAENKFFTTDEKYTEYHDPFDINALRYFVGLISGYNRDVFNILNNNGLTPVGLLLLNNPYRMPLHAIDSCDAMIYTFVNFGAYFTICPYLKHSHHLERIKVEVAKAPEDFKNAIAQGMLNFVLGTQGQFNAFLYCIRTNKALCNSLYTACLDITTEYTTRTILANVSEFYWLYHNKEKSREFAKMSDVVSFFASLTFNKKETIVYMLAKFVPQNKEQASLMKEITNCAVLSHKINVSCITTIQVQIYNIDQYVGANYFIDKLHFNLYLTPVFLACIKNNATMLNLCLKHDVDLNLQCSNLGIKYPFQKVIDIIIIIIVRTKCIDVIKILLKETDIMQRMNFFFPCIKRELHDLLEQDPQMQQLLGNKFNEGSRRCIVI